MSSNDMRQLMVDSSCCMHLVRDRGHRTDSNESGVTEQRRLLLRIKSSIRFGRNPRFNQEHLLVSWRRKLMSI